MKYFVTLFSPETHALFSASERTQSGYRARQRKAAERVSVGDILVCYVTRVSRWVGLFEVVSPFFEDTTPIFAEKDDPYFVRLKVKPLVWLPPGQGIPIHDPSVWPKLSFTREHAPDTVTWTGAVRTSLAPLTNDDGRFLDRVLREQAASPKPYPLDLAERFVPLDVDERDFALREVVDREGQGAFRLRLLGAYDGRCAITGEHTEPVLDAAHIQPYLGPRSNHLQNGLLLTKEFHALFDKGYVGITPDYEVRVSERLREDWRNGRRYYPYDRQKLLHVPSAADVQPSRDALAWHLERVFKRAG